MPLDGSVPTSVFNYGDFCNKWNWEISTNDPQKSRKTEIDADGKLGHMSVLQGVSVVNEYNTSVNCSS